MINNWQKERNVQIPNKNYPYLKMKPNERKIVKYIVI